MSEAFFKHAGPSSTLRSVGGVGERSAPYIHATVRSKITYLFFLYPYNRPPVHQPSTHVSIWGGANSAGP
eukprot:366303-Chlamydomonas_euryale.AAC.5